MERRGEGCKEREGGREGGRERCRERKREILPDRDASSLRIAATDGHDAALAAQSRLVRLTTS